MNRSSLYNVLCVELGFQGRKYANYKKINNRKEVERNKMNMILRITGNAMDMHDAGIAVNKAFCEKIRQDFGRGDDEEDDDWLDLEINDLDQLALYLKVFSDLSMAVFLTHKTEEVNMEYCLYNKKNIFSGKPTIRVEINRDTVAKNLNERIEKAIGILQESSIDRG